MGIPTVIDRLIQQAIIQVLGARWKIRACGGIKRLASRFTHRGHLFGDKPSIVVKHPMSSAQHFSRKSAFPLLFRPFPCPTLGF